MGQIDDFLQSSYAYLNGTQTMLDHPDIQDLEKQMAQNTIEKVKSELKQYGYKAVFSKQTREWSIEYDTTRSD